jgi:predicted anti-sigma-YlaC factor YlaD
MNWNDCDNVRDLLPLQQRGQLLAGEAAAVDTHLTGCAECRREAALIGAVLRAGPAVPAGLEARVLLAVRAGAVRRPRAPVRLAMAATVAAAVLGGSLVLQQLGHGPAPTATPVGLTDELSAPAVSWAVAFDPLLQASSALQQLSLEELELILLELDS